MMRFIDVKLSDRLEYVLSKVEVKTPYGLKLKKALKPYKAGHEAELIAELQKTENVRLLIEENPPQFSKIIDVLAHVKDIKGSIDRSRHSILTEIEIFEIKNFLFQLYELESLVKDIAKALPYDMHIYGISPLLKLLDPNDERTTTFYIYDVYSEKLKELRNRKKETEQKIILEKQKIRKHLTENYKLRVNPRDEVIISKDNEELLKQLKDMESLVFSSENYLHIKYAIKESKETIELRKVLEEIRNLIADEELSVRERLTKEIAYYHSDLTKNIVYIGNLDFRIAKALFAIKIHAVKPVIIKEHQMQISKGRHIQVEEMLALKKERYMPVSIRLKQGVTCITGANMGGKTITLEMIAITSAMVQFGLFPPCDAIKMGLSNYIYMSVGDNQSIARGLSSFGSEIEEIQRVLESKENRGLLLIDEFASGTNPFEGWAMSKGLIKYMNQRQDITVLTTHYDRIAADQSVVSLQVRGLSNVNFDILKREIEIAEKTDKLGIIRKYMDYQLVEMNHTGEVPKDAIRIAKLMGLEEDIIMEAEKQMKSY